MEPLDEGCLVRHRVFNVAAWMRWGVPLANRFFVGFRAKTVTGFRQHLECVGSELDCRVRLLEE